MNVACQNRVLAEKTVLNGMNQPDENPRAVFCGIVASDNYQISELLNF